MSDPQLPIPLPPPGSGWQAVLPYVLSAVTLVGGWFAAQLTAVAALQRTLLSASRDFVEDSQTQRASDSARISELETEVQRLRGVLRQSQQWEDSARRLAMSSGLTLPTSIQEVRDAATGES